ncbi:MAG TPA: type II secretion system protein GspL [Gammaproteobacteria bacterium]|nr:type II secretion system protein GspL [Gammaproteobacteria bacterium]
MTKLLDWRWQEDSISWPLHGVVSDQLDSDPTMTLLVPTQQVLLTEATLPTRKMNKVQHALPYALEDDLTEDVEQIHFAMGDWKNDSNQLSVAVVDKSLMDTWLLRIKEVGLNPKQLQPDVFALPYVSNHWSVWIEEKRALVRTGEQSGFATEPENLAFLIDHAIKQSADIPEHIDVYTSESGLELILPEFSGEIEHHLLSQIELSELAQHFHVLPGINLLQSHYSQKEQLNKALRPWIPAAMVLAISLVLQMSLLISDAFQVRVQVSQLEDELLRVYLTAFPDDKNVRDPIGKMQSQLAALQGETTGSGFIPLMSTVGETLAKTQNMRLMQISYRTGVLELALEIDSVSALDQLKERLLATRVDVEIASADKRDELVEARLRIREQSS